jgi:hypothetical protein
VRLPGRVRGGTFTGTGTGTRTGVIVWVWKYTLVSQLFSGVSWQQQRSNREQRLEARRVGVLGGRYALSD